MIYLRRVKGNSMLPAFKDGQIVWFFRRGIYKTGDVVLVEHDGLEKIKRIQEVDGNRVFVVGDNPAQSTDSRSFGWLKPSQIRGKNRFRN